MTEAHTFYADGDDGSSTLANDRFPPRRRRRRVSYPRSIRERKLDQAEATAQFEQESLADAYWEMGSLTTVEVLDPSAASKLRGRRHSLGSINDAQKHTFTMLHDLRSYFDPTYRLNTVREKLREEAKKKRMSVEDMFSLVDIDGSGEIDEDELGAMVRMLGVRLKKIDLGTLTELIDKSGNGQCDLTEFRVWFDYSPEFKGRRQDQFDEYNDKNLLLRESLKFDPGMLRVMNQWWDLVDSDESGSISCEEYIKLHLNLQRAIVHQKDFNVANARKLALQEWEFDCQGQPEMDKSLFMLSFFQMADAWRTGGIEPSSYLGFMNMLETRMTFRDEDSGEIRWAWERDILWDVHLWEKPMKEKPKRVGILERAALDAKKNRVATDLQSALDITGGNVTKDQLRQFLPQALVEAAARRTESRAGQRTWLGGVDFTRRRTAIVPMANLAASNGDENAGKGTKQKGGAGGEDGARKFGKTADWAMRLYKSGSRNRDRILKVSTDRMNKADEFQLRKSQAILAGMPGHEVTTGATQTVPEGEDEDTNTFASTTSTIEVSVKLNTERLETPSGTEYVVIKKDTEPATMSSPIKLQMDEAHRGEHPHFATSGIGVRDPSATHGPKRRHKDAGIPHHPFRYVRRAQSQKTSFLGKKDVSSFFGDFYNSGSQFQGMTTVATEPLSRTREGLATFDVELLERSPYFSPKYRKIPATLKLVPPRPVRRGKTRDEEEEPRARQPAVETRQRYASEDRPQTPVGTQDDLVASYSELASQPENVDNEPHETESIDEADLIRPMNMAKGESTVMKIALQSTRTPGDYTGAWQRSPQRRIPSKFIAQSGIITGDVPATCTDVRFGPDESENIDMRTRPDLYPSEGRRQAKSSIRRSVYPTSKMVNSQSSGGVALLHHHRGGDVAPQDLEKLRGKPQHARVHDSHHISQMICNQTTEPLKPYLSSGNRQSKSKLATAESSLHDATPSDEDDSAENSGRTSRPEAPANSNPGRKTSSAISPSVQGWSFGQQPWFTTALNHRTKLIRTLKQRPASATQRVSGHGRSGPAKVRSRQRPQSASTPNLRRQVRKALNSQLPHPSPLKISKTTTIQQPAPLPSTGPDLVSPEDLRERVDATFLRSSSAPRLGAPRSKRMLHRQQSDLLVLGSQTDARGAFMMAEYHSAKYLAESEPGTEPVFVLET